MTETPLTIIEAAEALGIARRTLDEKLKHPAIRPGVHFELRGNRKVFYRSNILQLRKALTECACKSSGSTAGRTPTEPDPTADESGNLLALRTLAAQRRSAPG